jgi:putative transposase
LATRLLIPFHMPRKKVPVIAGDPYQINARCINREWFDLPLPTVWSIMEDYLYLLAVGFSIKIHSFVLMPNHFHAIMSAPSGNLSSALLYFMRETSREITRLSGRINQTYGSRNYKTWLIKHHYFLNTYKYVYRNPVRAQLCTRVEDYPYSTLSGLLGLQPIHIPMAEDKVLFPSNFDPKALDWLNQTPDEALEDEMRRALKHPEFTLKGYKTSGRSSALETELL